MKSCSGEGFLERAAGGSAGFKIDAEIARERVASGNLTPQEGVMFMEAEGELSRNQHDQLLSCLGRIAEGVCTLYPSKVNN